METEENMKKRLESKTIIIVKAQLVENYPEIGSSFRQWGKKSARNHEKA